MMKLCVASDCYTELHKDHTELHRARHHSALAVGVIERSVKSPERYL